VMHLTEATYRALLAGSLPRKEARDLAAHLSDDCEACEQFLADRSVADGLDGLADAAMAGALPPDRAMGSDLEYARIQRALRAGASRPRRWPFRAAVAASLFITGTAGIVAWQLRAHAPASVAWDGVKGTDARPIPVRLRYLRLDAAGAVEKGLSGEAADPRTSLLFEVETGRPADVALLRVAAGGGVELIWRSRVSGGRTQVTVAGRPAAFPLASLSGPQRFVLLAGEGGIEEARAARAAAAVAPPNRIQPEAPPLDGLSFDVVELLVR
jgi:hypothetical protein